MSSGPSCPKEISKLAEKAAEDSSVRSLLFDHWLAAAECWPKSQLLVTLKSRKKNSDVG